MNVTRPKIVATILMHDCGEIVIDAVASIVKQVDVVLCIDTEPRRNDSIALARLAAKGKFQHDHLLLARPGNPEQAPTFRRGWNGSFADARNYALQIAKVRGGDWALTIDTDERIDWRGLDLRATLEANPTIDTYLMPRDDGLYAKERLFRLPATGEWNGRTHEAYIVNKTGALLPHAVFRELDKTPEQLRAKFSRDELTLREEIVAHPDDARWHFYLGATLKDTGRYHEAATEFARCYTLHGWAEEAAWAAYQGAICLAEHLGNPNAAADMAALGLARLFTPELAWYAGYLAVQTGRYRDAILWAEAALAAAIRGEARNRIFFRWEPAWREKPFEVLHFAHKALGHEKVAKYYHASWKDEETRRTGVAWDGNS